MKKKTITFLGMAALALSACGAAEDFTEGVQDGYESRMNEETEKVESGTEEVDKKELAEENARQFPADSVASFSGEQFTGMDYHFKGKAIGMVPAQTVGEEVLYSLLVENERGYVMIVAPSYEVESEIDLGAEIEVYGHLNGNGYDVSDLAPEAINSEAGLINAYEFYIDGQQLGTDIF